LRQADQARTDFALIEQNLEFISGELSRLPARVTWPRPRSGHHLEISTAALVILWAEAF
jgi:hypothetical protein